MFDTVVKTCVPLALPLSAKMQNKHQRKIENYQQPNLQLNKNR